MRPEVGITRTGEALNSFSKKFVGSSQLGEACFAAFSLLIPYGIGNYTGARRSESLRRLSSAKAKVVALVEAIFA